MEINLALKKAKLPENLELETAKQLNQLRTIADFEENETIGELHSRIAVICEQTVAQISQLNSTTRLNMRKLLQANVILIE